METVIILGFLTFFAGLVANRASNLGRNPWVWGITAWLSSPLLVWIALEICGRKMDKTVTQPIEEVADQKELTLQEGQLVQEETNRW